MRMEQKRNSYSLRQLARAISDGNASQRKHFGQGTDVYRVYDRFLRSFDLTVDLYADHALVTMYGPCADADEDDIRSCVGSSLRIPSSNVVIKSRIRKSAVTSNDITDIAAQIAGEPLASDDEASGEESDKEEGSAGVALQVHESGIAFGVDLLKRLDTGIFLENQRSRLLVKELAKGRNVLNLFCYTGGYTLFAYAGGASACTSVDTSSFALDMCKANMESNGFASDDFKFVRMDVMEFVKGYDGAPFDLIIIDCPSFSNRHGGRERSFSAQKDHVELITSCAKIMSKRGIIIFRTPLSTFELEKGRLRDLKIMTYTSEMIPKGFTRNSIASKTFVLKAMSEEDKRKMDDRRARRDDDTCASHRIGVREERIGVRDERRSAYDERAVGRDGRRGQSADRRSGRIGLKAERGDRERSSRFDDGMSDSDRRRDDRPFGRSKPAGRFKSDDDASGRRESFGRRRGFSDGKERNSRRPHSDREKSFGKAGFVRGGKSNGRKASGKFKSEG